MSKFIKGFIVSKSDSPRASDAPWQAWAHDGRKFRADTYRGLLALIRESVARTRHNLKL